MLRDPLSNLFPPIEPVRSGMLPVSALHRIYWEECGAANGIPIVFLHGGPGGGCGPLHRRFFDPVRYRIILYDQRGSGRSRPYAEIRDNKTALLVEDLEQLRRMLGIERWILFGGSWGSTLALAYGQAYPERCLGFILRGIFLFTSDEIDWFMNGMGKFFPEAERNFLAHLPMTERGDRLASYYHRLCDPDPMIHLPAARAWCRYEEACCCLVPDPDPHGGHVSLAMARLEAHYLLHEGFLQTNQLLANMARIRHLPATVIQGRYDVICPPIAAQRLADAWPAAQLVMIPEAGHSALEPGVCAALVAATEWFKRRAMAL